MTERLHFHFSLSCIGEGNGNPLQCSCLENPRDDGGAWWAAVYGVAQSQTRLKRLSSSSRGLILVMFLFESWLRNDIDSQFLLWLIVHGLALVCVPVPVEFLSWKTNQDSNLTCPNSSLGIFTDLALWKSLSCAYFMFLFHYYLSQSTF